MANNTKSPLKFGDEVSYIRNGTICHAKVTIVGSTGIVFLDNGHRVKLEELTKEK